ncbi:MAG: lipopolysaccharide biosynthesis protein [Syntrophus sp. (in: bacteria)]|nr:lipopolysaccharide biosynthesis protein [Syntrophus sp. (in: bacteria)]
MPTTAEHRFIKNILFRLLLNLPVTIRGFIVLPLLTRTYPPEIYGLWLQILLIKEILIPLLSLRLETALLRYLASEDNKLDVIKSVFTITACCCLIFVSSIFLFPHLLSNLIFGTAGFYVLLLFAAVWISIHACMHIGFVVLRSQERIKTLSLRELLSTLWLISAVTVAYLLRIDVNYLVVICIIGDSVLLIWILIQIGVPFPLRRPDLAFYLVKKYVPYSAPLIVNSLFLWFTKSVDRLLIIHLLGLSYMGVYGVSLQISNLLAVVLSPINYVLFPRAAASWRPDNTEEASRYFSQAATLTLVFGAPVIVGLYVISKGLIPLLAGQDYSVSPDLVGYLMFSGLALMIYQNHLYVIHLMEKTYLLPALFIFTAVVNYILGYVLISHIGLLGAGIARFVTFFVMAFIISLWARRYITFSLPWRLILKIIAISILMGICISWMPVQSWLNLILTTLAGVSLYLVLLIVTRVVTRQHMAQIKKLWK